MTTAAVGLSRAEKAALDALEQSLQESLDNSAKICRMLLYSDPGQGKTELAGRIAHVLGNRTAIFTTDNNWVTLTKDPVIKKEISRQVFDGFSQIQAFAKAHLQGVPPYCDVKTLIWDTVSTSTDIVLRKTNKEKKFKEQRDPGIPARPHYFLVSEYLKETIELLNQTSLHVIYLAHVRDPSDADREKKRFAIRPNMPEASYNAIAQDASAIGWLYKDKKGGRFYAQFEGTVNETAKSQIPTIEQKTYFVEEIPGLIQKWIDE